MERPQQQTAVTVRVLASSASNNNYVYKVKIINPLKKSDVVVRMLHQFKAKFSSVLALRTKLIEQFKGMIPATLTFKVGYFEGQKHLKMSIYTDEDLAAMYEKFSSGGDILLWCDGSSDEDSTERTLKRRREESQVSSRRQEREEEVDEIFRELKEKHANTYETPKLRLWARMIASNIHDSIEEPPKVPAFGSGTYKKPRHSFSNAMCDAATAFAKVLGGSHASAEGPTVRSSSTMSPGRTLELRMKNYEQLRYLQQLHDDGILTASEYTEQKESILTSLRSLST